MYVYCHTSLGPLSALPSDNASLRHEINVVRKQQHVNSDQLIISSPYHEMGTNLRFLTYAAVTASDSIVLQKNVFSARPLLSKRSDTGGSTSNTTDNRSPSLAITLSSHTLVRSTISAKISKGY